MFRSRLKMRLLVPATVVTVVAVVVAVGGAGAQVATATAAGPAAPQGAVISHAISHVNPQAVVRYWTPARMKAAIPVDTITIAGSATPSNEQPAPTGAPRALAPIAPGARPNGSVAHRAVGAAGVASPDSFSYPFPFTRFAVWPVSLYKKYPWEVSGKVFFTNNGGNYVCSGASVVSGNGSEVWTAGHCVSNTDGTHQWDSNFLFVPAYNGNGLHCCPKGQFVGDNFATTADWFNSFDFRRDMGAAHVQLVNGSTLAQRVGTAGFAWNQSQDQDFTDFGYPQAAPFDGTSMVECSAGTAVVDSGIGGAGPNPTGIGCDMTGGSSGGPWLIAYGGTTSNLQQPGPGYINGHNDYKYNNQPLAMYSPYYDDLANTVRCLEAGGGPGC